MAWGLRTAALSVVAATAFAGCSDDAEGRDGESGQCGLLNKAQVERLSGEPLTGRESTIGASDLPACQYGQLTSVGVQVTRVPADEWAAALPGMVEQVKAAGMLDSPELVRQLEKAADLVEEGKDLESGEACEYFGKLVTLQGASPRSRMITTYVPTRDDPQLLASQICRGDTYVSLSVGRPDLDPGSKLEMLVARTAAGLA